VSVCCLGFQFISSVFLCLVSYDIMLCTSLDDLCITRIIYCIIALAVLLYMLYYCICCIIVFIVFNIYAVFIVFIVFVLLIFIC
jgi:hypothetical protein